MLAITTENGSRSPGVQTPKKAIGSNRFSLFSEDSDDGTISVNLRIPRLAFDGMDLLAAPGHTQGKEYPPLTANAAESDYLVASKQTPAYARLLVERWAFDNRQMHAGAPSLLRTTKLCVQALNLSVHRDWVAAVERKDEPARCFLKNIKQAVTNYGKLSLFSPLSLRFAGGELQASLDIY